MSRPWMPLYVADYLADTGHLSAAEHGAYLMLIMHYWANEGLPDDDKKLARIARMTPDEWADARETVREFFSDGWRHERIEKELTDAKAAYERRAMAGRKGGIAKAEGEQCSSNATAGPKQSQSQSQVSSNELTETRERVSSPAVLNAKLWAKEFNEVFWPGWVNKVGKPSAEKAWFSARKAGCELEAIIAGRDRYQRDKPPDRPWLNPATFLNQRRFDDNPAGPASASSTGQIDFRSRLAEQAKAMGLS